MSNTPKIRFEGFTDDWEERKLEDVVDFLDTMRKPLEGLKRVSGPYPYYGASGIVDYVDGFLFDEELVLLSEDGANITDRNYPVCFLASGKYWVNNHAHVLRTKNGNENNSKSRRRLATILEISTTLSLFISVSVMKPKSLRIICSRKCFRRQAKRFLKYGLTGWLTIGNSVS